MYNMFFFFGLSVSSTPKQCGCSAKRAAKLSLQWTCSASWRSFFFALVHWWAPGLSLHFNYDKITEIINFVKKNF